MRFGPRELIVLVLILAIPVASYFLVFKPQNVRIERAKGEITHKLDVLDRLRAETARNDDLMRANEEIASRIKDIESRLPSSKEVDNIIRQVSDLAVQSGLSAPAMKSNDPISMVSYKEQPLKMETSGQFDGFYTFLQEVESLKRITRMPQMKLQRDGLDGDMKVEFTLSIYFLDEKEGK